MDNINYTNKELHNIIIENVLKMLWRRKLIDSWESELEKITDSNIITIPLSDKTYYYLNIINTPLTNIAAGTQLSEFLSNNVNIHKILIIKSISRKAAKQILHEYKNIEYFLENEMYEDIPTKLIIPKHEILNEEDTNELLTCINPTDLPKIMLYDKMSRYYNAKVGDIFKITRPSIKSVYSIAYRRVVASSIDMLFFNS